MFPFWEPVIAPVLRAAGVQNLVEIGALRGEHTRRIIEGLGPDTVLHVIDPVPDFDPAEHERRFGGQYVFHRRLSLDVLGDLPPMDAALIDGDHNWYTVINECRLLAEVAERHDALLPVLVLHDVAWPYGRRDLYYDPGTIPAEHRQPHRRAGMRPGRSELLPDGGMSAGHWNAEAEGGPGNGVMTGLDDFLAEFGRPVRTVLLPLYFGLAIVVEEARLHQHPALAAELDRIEGAEARLALLELGEEVRLRGVVNHHTTVARLRTQVDRLAHRYLDLVLERLGSVDPGLLALRAALDRVADGAGAGDVVLAVDDERAPGAAALAGAWLASRDDGDRHVWVVVADTGTGVAQRVAELHRELHLETGHLHVLAATPDGLNGLPAEIALLAADLGGPDGERNRAVTDAVRPRLGAGAVVIGA